MINTSEVIAVLRPGASFSVHGETIIWHDTVQTEPTRAEIDAKRAELDAAQPWIDARTERDQLLRDSDWTAVTDTALSEADQTDWEDYRQALRDIPQTYSDDVESVVWPDAPA